MSQLFSRQNELNREDKIVAIDIESTPIVRLDVEKIWSIAFYYDDNLNGCVYWPGGVTKEELSVLFKNAEYNYKMVPNEHNRTLHTLRSILACELGYVPAFHSAQFDKRVLAKTMFIPKYYCTQQLAYCLMPPAMLGSTGDEDALRFYSLSRLAKLGLCEAKIDFDSDWESFSKEMVEYNKQDAKSCKQLATNLLSAMDDQTFQAYIVDMCAMEMIINMSGCTIDSDALSEVFLEKEEELRVVTERLLELVPAVGTNKIKKLTNRPTNTTSIKRGIYPASDAGKYVVLEQKGFNYKVMPVEKFNPGSEDHVLTALKFKCNWTPKTFSKKSGKAKVDKATLVPLAAEWELAALILEYRRVSKLLSTYLRPYKETDAWGKLYPSFPLCATRTGRLASRNPNFQNVPDNDTRKLIVAPDGYDLVCIDLSQIELRILAWDMYVILGKQDKSASYLWDAYQGNKDVHNENRKMMGLEHREGGRKLAKIGKFLYIYGGKEQAMVQQLGITAQEAKDIISTLERNVPSLPALRNYMVGLAKSNPFIRTLYHHKITYPALRSRDRWKVMEAERQYFNARIQGTQADIIKILMWQCRKPMVQYSAQMLAQVHDELLFQVPKGNTKSFCEALMPLFNNTILLPGLPVQGVPGVGSNWQAAKKDGSAREDLYKEALKEARKFEFTLA